MKNIFLLGATGSIGQQVLDVIKENKNFKVKSISFNKNIELGKKVILQFKPKYVAVGNELDMRALQKEFPNIEFGFGEDGLVTAATFSEEQGYLVNAVVGSAGLKPTIAAIKKKRNVLLANKETLVMAGDIIKKLVQEYNVELLPIDSEHSAIFQCLKSGENKEISKLILTASGGALREISRNQLGTVTLNKVLAHPNWEMGRKITIDSATMVNKGLEVIEAHYLFNIDYQKIETLIHPESIIHSMVEFQDNSTIAQMSLPDMRIPIQYALFYPKRVKNYFPKLQLTKIKSLNFFEMDYHRYPLLKLAYEVGKMAGIMPAVYNAANEAAVELFILGKISFLDIEKIIFLVVEETKNIENPTIEEIITIDKYIKNKLLHS